MIENTIRKLSVFVALVVVYYSLGGAHFPDYQNYITISEKGGYLFLENEYFFEWVSRFWLRYVGSELRNHILSVDIFVGLIQLIYFTWLMHDSGDERYELSKFWITVFLGPLLLTTTLRGTPAYIAVFMILGSNYSILGLFFCFMLALSFHDSALLPLLVYCLARVTTFIDYSLVRVSVLLVGMLFIAIGSLFLQTLMPVLLSYGLGIREIYFMEPASPSAAKIVYAIFVGFLCALACIMNGLRNEKLWFMVLLYFFSAILFALSSTPAIRMLLYVFGGAILLNIQFSKGIVFNFFNSIFVQAFIAPLLIALMFWDLFRNASV